MAANKFPILRSRSHFTLIKFSYLLLLSLSSSSATAINISALLSSYPDFSSFASLLSSSPSLTADLTRRSSLTLLAVPNSYLASSVDFTRHLSAPSLADLLRYHVLLQYFSLSDLQQIPPPGVVVATLFQATGRASSDSGTVNITRNPASNTVTISSHSLYSPSNATVLSLVKTFPYNISILSVSSLLIPDGFNLMASETRPPLGLNITKALIDGHNFFVAASMLSASGVVDEFDADERGAGITLFVPTDAAFSDLPTTVSLQSLPAEKKAVVLKFHVLHSYYPLGSLESIVNPVQPTLATEATGAGSYTLNISRVNGSVAIDTGIVQASVTQTVFDQNPVAIFGVSEVLLPREIFGKDPTVTGKQGNSVISAPPPDISLSPESSPGSEGRLSSPPLREDITSAAINGWNQSLVAVILCIGLYLNGMSSI